MMQDRYDHHFSGMERYINEGHAYLSDKTVRNFKSMLATTGAKKILEIGFNAGHSTYCFLSTDRDIEVHSIDIGRHRYTRPAANKMEKIFGDRFKFGIKDSREITPEELSEGYDLAYIDGDHRYEAMRRDYINCSLAKIPYILIDDINLFSDIKRFVNHIDQSDNHPYKIHEVYEIENSKRRWNGGDGVEVSVVVLLKREDTNEEI
jgi:predicted O-methyltransferase YrrM